MACLLFFTRNVEIRIVFLHLEKPCENVSLLTRRTLFALGGGGQCQGVRARARDKISAHHSVVSCLSLDRLSFRATGWSDLGKLSCERMNATFL